METKFGVSLFFFLLTSKDMNIKKFKYIQSKSELEVPQPRPDPEIAPSQEPGPEIPERKTNPEVEPLEPPGILPEKKPPEILPPQKWKG